MTTTNLRPALVGLAIVMTAIACENNNNTNTLPINPLAPGGTIQSSDVVEFRVTGELPFPVVVRVNNAIDGLTQVTTLLPYSQTITIRGRDSVFVSLEARGTGVGFLHAAIFLNGFVFREGSSTANNPLVTVSGTYRATR